ncbi:MAG TPA: hypothetical protein VGP07_10290 [Polyangia bacterium]|jgi:hypothetical protein
MTSTNMFKLGRVVAPLTAALVVSLCGTSPARATGTMQYVEVSAPILPRVSVLYPAEGSHFPTASADIAALAHDAALTFDYLLTACAMNHTGIVIPGPGDPPTTPAQNASNFETIANCAYTDFVSKPYWIPALVDQVDLCGTELGADWHLLSEADVNGFSTADEQMMSDALSTPNAGSFFGNFYFSLHVWVRAADGSLQRGDLSPGATTRLSTLPVAMSSTTHYESDMSLRCIRRTTVTTP